MSESGTSPATDFVGVTDDSGLVGSTSSGHEDERRLAEPLVREWLSHRAYSRAFANTLFARARDRAQPWRVRGLATLLLQCQLVQLRGQSTQKTLANVANDVSGETLDEYRGWFRAFGWAVDESAPQTLGAHVLAQGYSTRALAGFIDQFHARIARGIRALVPAANGRLNAAQRARLWHLSQCESLLYLGRFVFSASEVIDRVEQLAITSDAVSESMHRASALAAHEVPLAVERLPPYEREIAGLLIRRARSFWIPTEGAWHTRGLLDHPARSAALVISPPGSDVEFEIKRAGTGEPRALDIIYRRAQRQVPPSHRLWGLCNGNLLRFEATAGARLARRYRRVHTAEASIARMLAIRVVQGVPGHQGQAHIMSYFTDERAYGQGFLAMRQAMAEGVAAFDAKVARSGDAPVPALPGPAGLTMRFFVHNPPAQALLVGTSSCRLDILARALAPEAPGSVPGSSHGSTSALQREILAAEVLAGQLPGPERELGDIEPLFSGSEARVRVEGVFLHVLEQLATLWATMLALRMVSHGESLVGRNLGLRTHFADGRWQVKVISMDHDRLRPCQRNAPSRGLRVLLCGTVYDSRFVFGYRPENSSDSADLPRIGEGRVVGSLDLLERIYRVAGDRARAGRAHFMAHLRAVYRRTRRAISAQVDTEQEFSAVHKQWSGDIDALARAYARAGGAAGEAWPRDCADVLAERAWPPKESARALAAIADNHPAMQLLADLVEPGDDLDDRPGDRS